MDDDKEIRPISTAYPFLIEMCPVCGKPVEAYDAVSSHVIDRNASGYPVPVPLSHIVLLTHRAKHGTCEGSRLKIRLADHLIREFQEVLNG